MFAFPYVQNILMTFVKQEKSNYTYRTNWTINQNKIQKSK